mmetsp:Transcript_56070/g.68587  ORF Transcript_56070/g.68587 Transcript_56070/m.68587 type:complete len:263 (+) Transcript_56070:1138-1926(+)
MRIPMPGLKKSKTPHITRSTKGNTGVAKAKMDRTVSPSNRHCTPKAFWSSVPVSKTTSRYGSTVSPTLSALSPRSVPFSWTDVPEPSMSLGPVGREAKRPSTTQSCTSCNSAGTCKARSRRMHCTSGRSRCQNEGNLCLRIATRPTTASSAAKLHPKLCHRSNLTALHSMHRLPLDRWLGEHSAHSCPLYPGTQVPFTQRFARRQLWILSLPGLPSRTKPASTDAVETIAPAFGQSRCNLWHCTHFFSEVFRASVAGHWHAK